MIVGFLIGTFSVDICIPPKLREGEALFEQFTCTFLEIVCIRNNKSYFVLNLVLRYSIIKDDSLKKIYTLSEKVCGESNANPPALVKNFNYNEIG